MCESSQEIRQVGDWRAFVDCVVNREVFVVVWARGAEGKCSVLME
jgi:hypothetical protein